MSVFLNLMKILRLSLISIFMLLTIHGRTQNTNVVKVHAIAMALKVVNLEYEKMLFPHSSLSMGLGTLIPNRTNELTVVFYNFFRYYPKSKPYQTPKGFYMGAGLFGVIERRPLLRVESLGLIFGYQFALSDDVFHIDLGVSPQFGLGGSSDLVFPVPIVNLGCAF